MISLLLQLNMYRSELGLAPVKQLNSLCSYADKRMVQVTTDWSHKGFIKSRPYKYMIENLSINFDDSEVITAWKNSPSHNANLKANVKYVCIKSGDINGQHYVVLEGKK